MSEALQTVYIARHGETAWSLSGQHTGLTDLPLTSRGERNAELLGARLRGLEVVRVLTSPLQRARRTAELAGFGAGATVDADLVEWNYGEYEGLTSKEILARRPDWSIYRDGCPGGESPEQIMARAGRAVTRLRAVSGDVLLFSSGHFIRVLAAAWMGLHPAAFCPYLLLDTASVSAVSYDRRPTQPAIRLWNDTHHVEE